MQKNIYYEERSELSYKRPKAEKNNSGRTIHIYNMRTLKLENRKLAPFQRPCLRTVKWLTCFYVLHTVISVYITSNVAMKTTFLGGGYIYDMFIVSTEGAVTICV